MERLIFGIYGILVAHALYGEYMLKFCEVCILITRLQSEIPRTQSHLHCMRDGSEPSCSKNSKQRKMAGQQELSA